MSHQLLFFIRVLVCGFCGLQQYLEFEELCLLFCALYGFHFKLCIVHSLLLSTMERRGNPSLFPSSYLKSFCSLLPSRVVGFCLLATGETSPATTLLYGQGCKVVLRSLWPLHKNSDIPCLFSLAASDPLQFWPADLQWLIGFSFRKLLAKEAENSFWSESLSSTS